LRVVLTRAFPFAAATGIGFASTFVALLLSEQGDEVEPTGRKPVGSPDYFTSMAFRLMHARELVDLAAVVAVHAPALIRAARDIPEESVEAYWVASKCRLDRWGQTLKRLSNAVAAGEKPLSAAERRLFRGVLEEILASEVLTRIWTAAMCAYDLARQTDSMEPVARSVLIGHMEARHRMLTLLVSRTGLTAEEAIQLNALRSRTERWADALIGYLASEYDVAQFAVEPDRAKDFADDFAHQRQERGGRYAWPLMLASLRAAFRHSLSAESPNPDLNARIAAGLLACFPAEVFDGTGQVVSAWLLRISHVAGEAEGMLEELLTEGKSGRVGEWERGRNKRWSL
jgi:hypothetical protein